jgi:hypothetical protein
VLAQTFQSQSLISCAGGVKGARDKISGVATDSGNFPQTRAGCWYLIGGWLDRRTCRADELKSGEAGSWGLTPQPLVLALAVFTLLYSYHLHIWSSIHIIERALAQTWAVFLIGVPVSGLARRLLLHGGHERATAPGRHALRPFSNFRLFVITMGIFAALLILGLLTGPTVPK